MRAADYTRVDTLIVEFISKEKPLTSEGEGLDAILEIVERHAGELMPTVMNTGRRDMLYSRAAAKKKRFPRHAEPIWGQSVYLTKEDKPEMELVLRFFPGGEINFRFNLRVLPLAFYRDEVLAQERSRRLTSFVRDMAHRFPPVYAYGHSDADVSMGREPIRSTLDASKIVDEAYWLNVYGKEIVDALGRERVLTTPAAHLEELPHGGVLFLTRPTPGDFDSEEARVAQARALVHLKPELSFDTVLAQLRERSAALFPVERDWDPDLVELLDYTLDMRVSLKDRQRETALLNTYRPPPVSEWSPLENAPASDVDEPERLIREYIHGCARDLVRALRGKVPEVMNVSPEALTPLDQHFWTYDYSNWSDRVAVGSILMPAVGAWLGELLVQNLGGRWVPRRVGKESYVVLGDRAWFPFRRAQHYLQSQQSVLDYSLTKFYREAERYVRARSTDTQAGSGE